MLTLMAAKTLRARRQQRVVRYRYQAAYAASPRMLRYLFYARDATAPLLFAYAPFCAYAYFYAMRAMHKVLRYATRACCCCCCARWLYHESARKRGIFTPDGMPSAMPGQPCRVTAAISMLSPRRDITRCCEEVALY